MGRLVGKDSTKRECEVCKGCVLAIGFGHAIVPAGLRLLVDGRERMKAGFKDCHIIWLVQVDVEM